MRRLALVAALTLAGGLLAGCTLVAPTNAPNPIANSRVKLGLLNRTIPGTNGASVHFITQPVYIVDATGHLAPSSRIVPSPPKLKTVVQQLLLGPSEIETSAGYTSALPKTLVLVNASVHHEIGYINLDSSLSRLPAQQQLLAVGQLVLTADDVGATRGIVIQVAGVAQSILLPNHQHAHLVSVSNFQVLLNG